MRPILLCLALCACADTLAPSPVRGDPLAQRVFTTDEAAAIVELANSASLQVLDDEVPLDSRAAENLVERRPYATLDEVDAVPYVGPSALEAMAAYVAGPTGELGYDADEVAAALAVANTATETELDIDVALDARAAAGLVAEREAHGSFESLAAVDAVPYVGASALDKLVAYGLSAEAPAGGCLILSEVIEGSGMNNKAVELLNCGAAPLDLSRFGLCLVRNDDADCTLSDPLPAVSLDAGAVHVVCRTRGGTFNDPFDPLRDACETEMPGTLNMSGNDRIVVFEDLDHTTSCTSGDRVVDMLGRFGWAPSWEIWADMGLRRCNPTPWTDTGYYDTAAFFTEHPRSDLTDLGVRPSLDGCPSR